MVSDPPAMRTPRNAGIEGLSQQARVLALETAWRMHRDDVFDPR